jgi:endonuclease YncB( thermonuclease family)
LSDLVLNKVVAFNPEKVDRHGRTVAVVRTSDGTDVCLPQIKAGLAWHFKRYENEQSAEERATYAAAEVIARAARYGLWREQIPVPPWEFREQRRVAPAVNS